MNETLAKLTPHLPLDDLHLGDAVATVISAKQNLEKHLPIDDLSLDSAVSTAKSVKHNLEQRYKKPARKSKARITIPVVGVLLVAAFVAVKFLRGRDQSQQTAPAAPHAPAEKVDHARMAVADS